MSNNNTTTTTTTIKHFENSGAEEAIVQCACAACQGETSPVFDSEAVVVKSGALVLANHHDEKEQSRKTMIHNKSNFSRSNSSNSNSTHVGTVLEFAALEQQEEQRLKSQIHHESNVQHVVGTLEFAALKSEVTHKEFEIIHLSKELKSVRELSERLSERMLVDAAETSTMRAEHTVAIAALRSEVTHKQHELHHLETELKSVRELSERLSERAIVDAAEASALRVEHTVALAAVRAEVTHKQHELHHVETELKSVRELSERLSERAIVDAAETSALKLEHTVALAALRSEVTHKENALHHLETELKSVRELSERLSERAIVDAAETSALKLEHAVVLAALRSEVTHKQHELHHLETELKSVKELSERLSLRVVEDAAVASTLRAEHILALEVLTSEVTYKVHEIRHLEAELKSVREVSERLSQRHIAEISTLRVEHTVALETVRSEVTHKEHEIRHLETELKSVKELSERLSERAIADISALRVEHTVALEAVRSEVTHKEHEIRHLETELKSVRELSERLSQRLIEDAATTNALRAEHTLALSDITRKDFEIRHLSKDLKSTTELSERLSERLIVDASAHSALRAEHTVALEQIMSLKAAGILAKTQAIELTDAKHRLSVQESAMSILKIEAESHKHELFHSREQHTKDLVEIKTLRELNQRHYLEFRGERGQHIIDGPIAQRLREQAARHELELITIGELQNRQIKEEHRKLACELVLEKEELKKLLEVVKGLKEEGKVVQHTMKHYKEDMAILVAKNKVLHMELDQAKRSC